MAHAVVNPEGAILADTVQDSERGAMVNGLITHGRCFVRAGWSDQMIRDAFRVNLEPRGYRVARVEIREMKQ